MRSAINKYYANVSIEFCSSNERKQFWRIFLGSFFFSFNFVSEIETRHMHVKCQLETQIAIWIHYSYEIRMYRNRQREPSGERIELFIYEIMKLKK